MKNLWKTIALIGSELHPDRAEMVADTISTLQSSRDIHKIRGIAGLDAKAALLEDLGQAWNASSDVTAKEIAAALRCASRASDLAESRESVDMVWTGPMTRGVPSRHTEQVLMEVIDSAEKSLFLVSFVAYNVESIKGSLRKALERGVSLNVLLEASKSHGGKIDIDSIKNFQTTMLGARVYSWVSNKGNKDDFVGAVHAKCAVADGKVAFISSANLTGAAMEHNMELGVLIRGGDLPERLHRHLDALIDQRIIERV